MSGRRILIAAALCLLALPAWAQQANVVMQPMSQRPQVDLNSPVDGQHFVTGETVYISATAFSFNGEITQMSAKVDGVTVGTSSGDSIDYGWTATLGTHTVSASAKDVVNMTATSPSITITVVQNQMPAVSLTGPSNGTNYTVGATVPMTATASDADGTIKRVEFWVDGVMKVQDTSSPYAYNWTATAGNHTLQAKAVDNANGTATSASVGIFGNLPPSAVLTSPANGAVYTVGTVVPVTANASDSGGSIARVEFWVDGAMLCQDTASPYACNWTATTGAHSVKAKAVDNLGAAYTTPVNTITGNVLPSASLTSPAAGSVYVVGTPVPMAATASDSDGTIARVEFWVDVTKVGEDTTSPYAYNWPATAGAHGLRAKAVDNLGGITTSSSVGMTGDVAPTVTLTGPADDGTYTAGTTVPMTATASDSDGSIARVEFWVDGAKAGEDASSPYAYDWTAITGTHSMLAKAVDDLGVVVATPAITVNGNPPPIVSLTAPVNGASFPIGAYVSMTATASDGSGGGSVDHVEFLVDGAKVGQDYYSPYAYDWPVAAGSHSVQAKAIDNLGATKTTTAISIFGNETPVVALTAPASGAFYAPGATVPMTATASDDDGSIARVEFWVDGAKVADDASSPYAYDWTMTTGSHTLQAKAVDDRGAVTDGGTATIRSLAAGATALTRQYIYNSAQELCRVDEPETGATLMGYDGAGNLAWSASGLPAGTACDAEGDTPDILARKATRTYDARNRVSVLAFADHESDTAYTYTPTGQLATIEASNGGDGLVTTTYSYNRRDLPTREDLVLSGVLDWPVNYGYDANGHLAVQSWHGLSIDYAPNALGQATQAGDYVTDVRYWPNGAIRQFNYRNGIVHTLTQNVRGLPDVSKDAYGSSAIHQDEYAYDQAGNVVSITDAATGQNQKGNRDMAYDGLNRLTSTSAPDMFGTASYAYDVQDNLKHVQVTAGSQPRNVDYCYDAANRLTNITSANATYCGGATVTGLGYDVQGNLANKSGVLYAFDQGNRLRSVNGGSLGAYLYDGHGRRVQDSVGGVAKYSQYTLSGQLVMTGDNRAGKVREYIALGGSLVLIRERDVPTGYFTMLYQHNDALGSPVAVTTETRALVERREYEPYGYQTAPFALQDGPNYTGHVADAATGLVYMQQRYYDPLCGCFVSTDPVTALKGPFNRYWYANANPYKFTDPDGRQSFCSGATCSVVNALKNVANGTQAISEKAEAVSQKVEKVDVRLEASAALGAGVEGSVSLLHGDVEIGFIPVGQGADVNVSLQPREGFATSFSDKPVDAPAKMSGGAEIKGGALVHGGVEAVFNPGGSVEIVPKVGVGLGEIVKYSPTINFIELGKRDPEEAK